MTSTISTFLRRAIYFLLLLLAVLVILGSIIVSQLDLDDYRHEIEQELSTALEQPVKIGRSKLTFNKGLALRFRDLQIGPEEALLADIPYLTATLKIGPLLEGQIFLDRVEIDEPKFQFWFPVIKRPKRGTTHQLTDKFGIRTLTIRDAGLRIHQRQQTGSRELLNLKNLHTELHGWQPNSTASLSIAGQLQQAGQPAEFLIDFNLPSSPDPKIWRKEEFSYQLKIDNLYIGATATGAQNPPGSVNLNASIRGVPDQGARIEAILNRTSGREQLFKLSGQWQSSAEQEAINQLTGELFGLPIKGEFYLLRQEQNFLAGRIGVEAIAVTRQLLDRWQIPGTDKLLGGTLERLSLVLEKSWPADQPWDGLPRIGAELTIADLQWRDNSLRQVQDFSAELSLQDRKLEIRDGLLVAGRQPIFFSGQIDSLLKKPQLNLNVELHAELQDLRKQMSLPDHRDLAGSLPSTLQLSGPLQQPAFQLKADFSKTALSLGPLLKKTARQKSRLLLEGFVDSEQVQLDRLELQLPASTISGNGCFSLDPASDYFLLDIDPIKLAGLQTLSPLLKKLRLQGTLHPSLERAENGLQSSLQLINVGAHLNNIVGDLSQADGRIDLDRQGLNFANLQATFGQSAFTLNGQLNDWQNPSLDLTLHSKKVRAHDLIFRNRKLHLYNLDGKVKIDGRSVNFTSVKVQLEKATEVVVTGSITDFSDPQVTLDIAAEKANIDQVIALFIGPHKTPQQKHKPAGKPLIINARVKTGSIGELQFQNAEGLIKDQHGVFTIYPLRFLSGDGFCLARIELDHNPKHALLKVSGHAEGINATFLHQELFKERGLINGALRGDFYLEGSLDGGGFWQNAIGGIHMQVEKGTLRKFRGLARVFSLLNVSQLFVGQLPDMDKEGMPFTLLEGSVRIADGRAYTEEMRIISEAMNMSVVGSQSLLEDSLDYHLVVMPLRTVDKVITAIPIAGWVLAGEEKALLTAHFKIEGSSKEPKVTAVPINTLSNTVFGIVKRTLGLPGKLVKDLGSLFDSPPKKKAESTK